MRRYGSICRASRSSSSVAKARATTGCNGTRRLPPSMPTACRARRRCGRRRSTASPRHWKSASCTGGAGILKGEPRPGAVAAGAGRLPRPAGAQRLSRRRPHGRRGRQPGAHLRAVFRSAGQIRRRFPQLRCTGRSNRKHHHGRGRADLRRRAGTWAQLPADPARRIALLGWRGAGPGGHNQHLCARPGAIRALYR